MNQYYIKIRRQIIKKEFKEIKKLAEFYAESTELDIKKIVKEKVDSRKLQFGERPRRQTENVLLAADIIDKSLNIN